MFVLLLCHSLGSCVAPWHCSCSVSLWDSGPFCFSCVRVQPLCGSEVGLVPTHPSTLMRTEGPGPKRACLLQVAHRLTRCLFCLLACLFVCFLFFFCLQVSLLSCLHSCILDWSFAVAATEEGGAASGDRCTSKVLNEAPCGLFPGHDDRHQCASEHNNMQQETRGRQAGR